MSKRIINFEELNLDFENKIILLDVDGCLIPDGGLDFTQGVISKIRKLKEKNAVFICTNSRDKIRKSKIEESLQLLIITKSYKKPSRKIISALEQSGPHSYIVIGDKVLIDGLFARNIGAKFLKVKRKLSGEESISVRFVNFIDDLVWKIIQLKKLT